MFNRSDYNFIVKYGEITPDGVAVFDLNSRRFVYMNRFISQIFEGEEQPLLKDPNAIMKLVHPEDHQFVEHRYRELLSIGCIPPTEFRVTLHGSIKHVSAEVLWLEESYTFAIFLKDVSAAREHEDYVVKFSAQKDALLDMLIHNLSGPLYMSSDMMAMAGRGDAPGSADLLGFIKESNEQCIQIINDFLKREHESSVEVSIKKSRFDVVEKLEAVLNMMRTLSPGKTFILNNNSTNSSIDTDPVKFLQVIHNILSNSAKFTPEGGSIITDISDEEDMMLVTITDTGIGIPEAIQATLLKQRVYGRPGLSGEKSNGYGLLYVKQLLDKMTATIKIESREEEGCRVEIRIPRDPSVFS